VADGGVATLGRIAGQHPAPFGVTERLGDDGVHIPDGARRQAAPVHPGVQVVEINGTERLQLVWPAPAN
jgi:hypothetical protein